MKNILFIFVIAAAFLSGCSAVDSIKIGGGYTGEDGTKVEGDVEVVLSKDESSYTGLNILENATNPDEKFVVLSKSQAKKILDKTDSQSKNVLSISEFKKLSEMLKK